MRYNYNGKNINIPDEDIKRSMDVLHMTKEEAIQLWLEDEGYEENEVVEALTAKAKENKINKGAKSDKPRKQVKRERKPDAEKENIIQILAKALENEGITPQITNIGKIIEFSVGENNYKLDLIKKRPPKK